MTQSFDRRSFIAGGIALGAGAAMLGGLEGAAGAAQTNGPGLNGVSTARPVRGGSLTMGIDTEESGFNPSTARWDEGGFLYGRTVFDPLAIVNAAGGVEPYLAESITSNEDFTSFTVTLRPGIVFHDGTPLDANALHLNIENSATSILTGPAFADQIASASVSGPLSVTIAMKTSWAPFPYYLAQAQTGYIAAPSMLNSADGGTSNPVGTGPFVFQDWVPNSHMTASRNPHYWRKGYPYLNSITYKPIINANFACRSAPDGPDRHDARELTRQPAGVPGQQEIRLLRQQRTGRGPADSPVRHAEHFHRAVQQQDTAAGHGQGRQHRAVLQGHRQGHRRPDERPLPAGQRVLHQDQLPQIRRVGRGQARQAGPAADGPAGHFHAEFHQRPGNTGGGPVPAAGLADGGHEGQHSDHRPGDDHQRRAGRHVPGHPVAPVRRRRPGPQLRVVEHPDRPLPHWP